MEQNIEQTTPLNTKLVFWKKYGQKLVALVFWVILIAAYQWYVITNSLSPLEVVQ